MGFCSDLAALLCGFEAEGANEGIEIIDNPLTEAINFRSLVGAEKDRGECRVDLLYLLAKLKNACGEFYATD